MTVPEEIFRRYLGWCPHAGTPQQGVKNPAKTPGTRGEPEWVPDSPVAAMTMPYGFTALSVLIVFATLFVGGYFWWPAFVLGVTGAGILVMYARNGNQENTPSCT